MENLVGKRFGKLVVIKQDLSIHKNRRRYWIWTIPKTNKIWQMKEEYYLKNNLKLIIIPYVDFELLDEEYLLKRMV